MTRRYTLEMAVDLRVPSNPRLSPDSRQVAFCVAPIGHREKDPTSTIHVAPTDGSTAPRAITGSEHNNTLPRWSPDATRLAFLSDRPKRGDHRAPNGCTVHDDGVNDDGVHHDAVDDRRPGIYHADVARRRRGGWLD